MLSVILPAYNEMENIRRAYEAISGILQQAAIHFEIIFVDDGSRDETWKNICTLKDTRPFVKGISFSRNFGKEAAILAGLSFATGDCCAVLDCDLQHPPDTLVQMYRLWQQGYEVIEGVKKTRGAESPLHTFAARAFYRMISAVTRVDMRHTSDFKLLDRKAVDSLLRLPEKRPFFRALSSWIGFKSTCVEFEVQERQAGVSKWSSFSLIQYAISNITSFSTFPLQLVTGAGLLFLLFAVVLGIQTLAGYFSGQSAAGFTTVILLILVVGSILMIGLGIIGLYVAKIYEEVRNRPRYIVSQLVASQALQPGPGAPQTQPEGEAHGETVILQ